MYLYVPTPAAMSRAIKKRLRQLDQPHRIGYLGELMQENEDQARREGTLRYRPEHLRLLQHVREHPEMVDVAFDVLTERLAVKGVELPTTYDERLPYDPDYRRIFQLAATLAILMTVLITLAVVLVSSIAIMTTLIVLVSVVGAAVFIAGLFRLTIPVDPTGDTAPGGAS